MYLKKITTESRTADTMLPDSALTTTLTANTIYMIEGLLRNDASGSVGFNERIRFNWITPPGLVRGFYAFGGLPSAFSTTSTQGLRLPGTSNSALPFDFIVTFTGGGAGGDPSGSFGQLANQHIYGTIHTGGSGGTFALNWGQNTTDGAHPTRVFASSWLKIMPV